MIALLLAASLATPAAAPLVRQSGCNAGMLQTSTAPALLMRPRDSQARARKLGELPRAKAEFAVVRLVDGCMVAAPAGYAFKSK
jgi:hypothetical protein